MARRTLTIEEEHGIYRVRRADGSLGAHGSRSLERAIITAATLAGVAEDGELEVRSLFEVGELFETLLGPKRDDSELVTG